MGNTQEQEDFIAKAVSDAITAVQLKDSEEIEVTLEALAPLETGDVIAELFIWVSDITADVSNQKLLQAAVLPMPPNPLEILNAVQAVHLGRLQAAVGSTSTEKIFVALLALVASLKDARTRI